MAAIQPAPTVKTILTQDSIYNLELLLHWYSEWLHNAEVTEHLMILLATYVTSTPKEAHRKTTSNVIQTVSKLIQLREQLNDVAEHEMPWCWKNGVEGWEKDNK